MDAELVAHQTPISGVANCHAEGVYSFVLGPDERVFYCEDWTTLAANDFGDAVGFHDHHRNLWITVLHGEIMNIRPEFVSLYFPERTGPPHPYGFSCWRWDSQLRGGRGRFTLEEDVDEVIGTQFTLTHLHKGSTLYLPHYKFHTIKQLSKVACWLVTEEGDSTDKRTENWSRRGLKTWHRGKDWYRVLSDQEIASKWKQVRSHLK